MSKKQKIDREHDALAFRVLRLLDGTVDRLPTYMSCNCTKIKFREVISEVRFLIEKYGSGAALFDGIPEEGDPK